MCGKKDNRKAIFPFKSFLIWSYFSVCHSHSSGRRTLTFCRAVQSWGTTVRSWPPPPAGTEGGREFVWRHQLMKERIFTTRVSDLQLVFEKARVWDSIVDLRQQSFDVLHGDAERKREKKESNKHSSRSWEHKQQNKNQTHRPQDVLQTWDLLSHSCSLKYRNCLQL